jgi:hypothetical protein
LGQTIKYFVTGVRPDQDVNEVIAMENHPLMILGRLLCCSSNKKSEGGERRVKYRRVSQLPAELKKLIKDLTHYDPRLRLTVRTARRFPYVEQILEGCYPTLSYKEIDYLSEALEHGNKVSSSSPPLRHGSPDASESTAVNDDDGQAC